MKKALWTSALIAWMIVIFMFSNQNGEKSQNTSDGLIKSVINITYSISHQELSLERQEELIAKTSFFVRKTAHFTIYFILGLISYFTLDSYGVKKKKFYCILFCFLYACSDEIHQLFSAGRGGRLLDVGIDTSGSILGVYIVSIMNRKNINK